MSKIVKTWDGHQGELLYIKGKIAFIKESNGEVWFCLKTDIIDFDEINMEEYYVKDAGKITYIYGVDLEEHIRVIEKLQHQLDQQKAMWQKLKEFISNQIIHYDELSDKFKEENNDGCVLLANSKRSMIEEILYKMQELEKGEKE